MVKGIHVSKWYAVTSSVYSDTIASRKSCHYLHLWSRTATAMIRANVVTARTADSSISFLSRGVLWRQNLGTTLKPNAQLASLYLTTAQRTMACNRAY
jgi:uncharacterized membrane protein